MEIFVVDAFTTERFSGNQAGVVFLGESPFPSDIFCCQLAGELKHSETVFIRTVHHHTFHMRYFTPGGEVDLCGHATVAAFTVLRELLSLSDGTYNLVTKAGKLSISLEADWVWMDMATPNMIHTFSPTEIPLLYQAYHLTPQQGVDGLVPQLVSTGLADILLPVKDVATLHRAVQNKDAVCAISTRYHAVGFHLFALGEGFTAHCRNFAPRYDIDEECATGTANGALSYYLYHHGLVSLDETLCFCQGETMGRPSQIQARVKKTPTDTCVTVGGRGIIVLRCTLEP